MTDTAALHVFLYTRRHNIVFDVSVFSSSSRAVKGHAASERCKSVSCCQHTHARTHAHTHTHTTHCALSVPASALQVCQLLQNRHDQTVRLTQWPTDVPKLDPNTLILKRLKRTAYVSIMTKDNLRIFGVSPFSGRKKHNNNNNKKQAKRRPAKRNRIALQKHFLFNEDMSLESLVRRRETREKKKTKEKSKANKARNKKHQGQLFGPNR